MIKKYEKIFINQLEAKLLTEDMDNWCTCLNSIGKSAYVPLQFKPGFLRYQEEYFRDVYSQYKDVSLVLYRGGRAIAIWSVCLYDKEGQLTFGTSGDALMGPLFTPALPKAEARRTVIENCLSAVFNTLKCAKGESIRCCETILDQGGSQWIKKLMEHGAKETKLKWQAFVDLSLSCEEIQSRIRRTNKYSVAKGQDTYNIEVYDEAGEALNCAFDEFHSMHREIAGRETRNQTTWDWQKRIIEENDRKTGKSFLIFIRDKEKNVLAGSALFDTTPQSGLYCVAAYDRSRFSKPVGHIVQAVALEKMREMGVRWYEIGERAYPGDEGVNAKLVNIGHYKEGFATHIFPRIFVNLDRRSFFENILK